jgi:hypothetical protein
MDFPSVTTVIRASPPELYTQRVGRSGRGIKRGKACLLAGGVRQMLAQLTGVDTVAKTDLAVPENNVNIQVPKSGEGFKSLIGAYKTDAKMLGWKMKTSYIFVGAGQQVPTLTKQYAGKVNVKPGDGLIIEGAAGGVVATGRSG